MAALNLPDPYAGVDALAEQGDYAAARAALARAGGDAARSELCDVKIGMLEGTIPAQIAMNRILALMQKDPKLAGAHELYRDASNRSYQSGASSLSHSHPPPPVKAK
jgi:hypothetical protein